MQGRCIVTAFLGVIWWTVQALAEGFLCAGSQGAPTEDASLAAMAAKPARIAQSRNTGIRRALVLFARFKGEDSAVPSWAVDVFNPQRHGSFSHFYDTMSFGKLKIRGEVAPRVYESAKPASAYLPADPSAKGLFGQFAQEILRQADQDLDFAQFDNDGPDGSPNSGDDDGVVDAVFLVLESIPTGFLRSEATGISNLGFSEVLLSGDAGGDGKKIQIFSSQGTIQQGRSFAEAMGAMCHEYGHILGLPDLYNTDFIGAQGAGPEEDGAGVGAWCLMGWGASGWQGDDGPNSFCAWSRMKLGWSPVISPSQERQQLELKDVGQGGTICQLPVNDREAFLVEYRRRDGNYYDRHIPAEGVLIWHLSQRPLLEATGAPQLVDLECADGRWRDAGYPQGEQLDSEHGGDNLDFWAHDAVYARAHGGNLGDATDLFDGTRFTAFTPETNPSAYSNDGKSSLRIESIHIEDSTARLQVQTAPPRLTIGNFRVVDANRDGFIGVGEEVEVRFWITNQGGVNVSQLRAVLSAEDSLVEVLQGESSFGELKVGKTEVSPSGDGLGFPRFRLAGDFAATHSAALHLDLYAGDDRIVQYPFAITAGAARQLVQEVSLIDSSGNQDGQAQAGEIVRLSIALADQHESILPGLGFLVRSLDTRVEQLGSPTMLFRMKEGALARSVKAPEFLLPSTLEAGAELPFELEVNGVLGTWKDTVYVQVHEGGDQTPPRVNLLRTQAGAQGGLEVLLADRWIIDGSELRSARAIFYSAEDTSQLAAIPLERREGEFAGAWREASPGVYLVTGEVEDAAGNWGRSPLLKVAVVPRGSTGGENSLAGSQAWGQLHLPVEQRVAEVAMMAMVPSDAHILYAADLASLWRSEDGGQRWNKTGLMLNGVYNAARLFVDPQDPLTVYLTDYGQVLKSRDGGQHWAPVAMPDQLSNAWFWVDTVLPGRLYGASYSPNRLLVSEDEGQSWRQFQLGTFPSLVVTHPTAPQSIYLGDSNIGRDSGKAGTLWHSSDGGHTWQEVKLDRVIRGISPDPNDPEGLYGVGVYSVWYSVDQGRSWKDVGQGIGGGISGVQVHPRVPEVLYVWGGIKLWVSRDKGATWQSLSLPGEVGQLSLDPSDPSRGVLLLSLKEKNTLWRFGSFGAELAQIEIYQEDAPAGAMAFNPDGQPFVATIRGGKSGTFTSVDGGSTWEWQLSPGFFRASLGNSATFFEMLYLDPAWPQIMIAHYALGLNQFVRSADGGQTWKPMAVGNYGVSGRRDLIVLPRIVGDSHRPGVYYLGARAILSQEVWRSTDFGEIWEKRGGIPSKNFYQPIAGLLLDPLDEETLYAAVEDAVWFSEDAGQEWVEIGQVQPGETVLTMEVHPVDALSMYAVTTGGLYLSEDRAQTWAPLFKPEGAPWASAQLHFDPQDPNHLYLVTSRYLYESGDAGQTWVETSQDFEGFPWFNDLAFDPFDPSRIYVTTSRGIYRLNRTQEITAVEEMSPLPNPFSLAPNYPNPFNPTTTLRFSLPQPGEAELAIYNLLGQRVATLVRGVQEAGAQVVQWNGRDEQGRELTSGVYLYRLQAGGQVETRKLLLLK